MTLPFINVWIKFAFIFRKVRKKKKISWKRIIKWCTLKLSRKLSLSVPEIERKNFLQIFVHCASQQHVKHGVSYIPHRTPASSAVVVAFSVHARVRAFWCSKRADAAAVARRCFCCRGELTEKLPARVVATSAFVGKAVWVNSTSRVHVCVNFVGKVTQVCRKNIFRKRWIRNVKR